MSSPASQFNAASYAQQQEQFKQWQAQQRLMGGAPNPQSMPVNSLQGYPGSPSQGQPNMGYSTASPQGVQQNSASNNQDVYGLRGANMALDSALTGTRNVINQGASDSLKRLTTGRDMGNQHITEGVYLGAEQMNPYADSGRSAQNLSAALMGALGPEAQALAIQNFQDSPGQQFLQDRGERSIMRNASAAGGLGGGNVLKELQQFGTGLAAQEFNTRLGQLEGVADRGMSASTSLADIFGNAASQKNANAMQTGALKSAIDQSKARDISALQQHVMDQRVATRMDTGENISSARGLQAQQLAELDQLLGKDLSQLNESQMTQLADFFTNTGFMQGETLQNQMKALQTLLANIQSGFGSLGGYS